MPPAAASSPAAEPATVAQGTNVADADPFARASPGAVASTWTVTESRDGCPGHFSVRVTRWAGRSSTGSVRGARRSTSPKRPSARIVTRGVRAALPRLTRV